MLIKPYKCGTEVIVSNYHEDDVFIIQSYDYKYKHDKNGETEYVMYNLTHKHQHWSWKQLNHDHIIPANSIDDLLILYQDFKTLYDRFGDSEYLIKLKKIENRLRIKTIENRGNFHGQM